MVTALFQLNIYIYFAKMISSNEFFMEKNYPNQNTP